MKFKSIKAKLCIMFGILIFIICAGLGSISYLVSENSLSSSINESLFNLARESSKVVEERINGQLNALEALAESDFIKSDKLNLNEKLKLLKNEVKRDNHLWMIIVDTNGNAITTWGENTKEGQRLNVSDLEYFQRAKSGKGAVSDPFYSKMTNDLVVTYAVPIKDKDKVKGVLVSVRDGNALSTLTNDIKFGSSGEAFVINKEGSIVANKDKNLVVQMYNAFEEVKKDSDLKSLVELEKQMVSGKEGVGEYTYKGISQYMGYAPIEGTNWFLAITAQKSEAMGKVYNLLRAMVIISIIILAVGMVITYFIACGISNPIKIASEYLSVVAAGDFTKEVPLKLLKLNDETGILANSINTMQTSIKNIIKEVIDESSMVSNMLININSEMEQLNKGIEEISATTEELSAGTEETASSTEEMSATSTEIEKAVESVASKSQEGVETVNNVSNMAEAMKQDAITSKENAMEIYERTKNSLQEAINQSKAVNQINELSEAILEITSQTNLLALNAAIEAARAGQAGKGFSVVAEEIGNLAEDSKNAVTRIKEVTNIILEAVNNLSDSSMEILEFVDKKVFSDYEKLVESSDEYSRNSLIIDSMVTDFGATSEELFASVQNMAKAIDEIAESVNEEAQGTTNIAQEAESITRKSKEVIDLAESAKEKSNILIKIVSKFKV